MVCMIIVWMAQIHTQRSEPELFQTSMALILSETASQLPNDRTASFVRCVLMNIGAHLAGNSPHEMKLCVSMTLKGVRESLVGNTKKMKGDGQQLRVSQLMSTA